MNLNKPAIVLLLILSLAFSGLRGQPPDYAEIFGKDWEKANAFVISNEGWMRAALRRERIDYNTAIAVVFPELVRYSALRDKMEITLLKALYVNLGSDYSDFSVGNFQIKPTFAELICESAGQVSGRKSGMKVPERIQFDNERDYRSAIVKSLEDTHSAFVYIIMFLKICEMRFGTDTMDEAERIKFLATAYNFGFTKSMEEIENMTGRKFFSTRIVTSEYYSYQDISLFWFNKNRQANTY